MPLVRVHILNKDVQTVDKYTIPICKNKKERPRKSFVFVSTLLGGGCLMTDLFRCCHEINGCVVLIILLKQTEGELVVYQKMIYKKKTNFTYKWINHAKLYYSWKIRRIDFILLLKWIRNYFMHKSRQRLCLSFSSKSKPNWQDCQLWYERLFDSSHLYEQLKVTVSYSIVKMNYD